MYVILRIEMQNDDSNCFLILIEICTQRRNLLRKYFHKMLLRAAWEFNERKNSNALASLVFLTLLFSYEKSFNSMINRDLEQGIYGVGRLQFCFLVLFFLTQNFFFSPLNMIGKAALRQILFFQIQKLLLHENNTLITPA